jgi:hypothetical protein
MQEFRITDLFGDSTFAEDSDYGIEIRLQRNLESKFLCLFACSYRLCSRANTRFFAASPTKHTLHVSFEFCYDMSVYFC